MKTLKSKLVMLAVLMVGAVAMSFTMIDKNSEKELQDEHTYYVTGLSGSDYQITQTAPPVLECESAGNSTCVFTSPHNLGSTIDKDIVDNEMNDITVLQKRNFD